MNMEHEDRLTVVSVMDPAHDSPGYWDRFRATVMERAVFELARRREMARESVAAVLSGWSRSLIPVALAAAVIAAVLVGGEARSKAAAGPPLALEDVLASEVQSSPYQAVTRSEEPANLVAFLALVEGNSP